MQTWHCRSRRSARWLAVLMALSFPMGLAAAGAMACSSSNTKTAAQRQRDYKIGKYEKAPTPVSDGSLWQDSSRGLFADFRAGGVGDLVTVVIAESVRSSGDATLDMKREATEGFGVPQFFGLTTSLKKLYPDIDPNELLRIVGDSKFNGDGKTDRNSQMRGTISVRVKKLLPNGDLFVEGTKTTQINGEKLHIYISGVVRPQDIKQDNSVDSGLVADAEVEFTGQGPLTDNQRPGWLARFLAKIRPM